MSKFSANATDSFESNMNATIQATAQQSRFHIDTLNTSKDIDLKCVTLAVGKNGEKEVLVDTDVKLKEGRRYALIGRNGSGKSTLFQALSQYLIPGLSKSIKILLLSQVEDENDERGSDVSQLSALDFVIKGDRDKVLARERHDGKSDPPLNAIFAPSLTGASHAPVVWRPFIALNKLLSDQDVKQVHLYLLQTWLIGAEEELKDAQDIAARRSGTRGKAARLEVIKKEAIVDRFRARLDGVRTGIPTDDELNDAQVTDQALALLTSMSLQLETLDVSSLVHQASKILHGLGFPPEMMQQPYQTLSGGWKSRCSLAKSLLVSSDMLLLDEPSNYLDIEATLWLEAHLSSDESGRTIVITSHDQDFLDNVVEETIYIRDQQLKYFDGTPTALQVEERKKTRRMKTMSEAMDKKKEHIQQSIRQGMATAKKTGDDNRMRMAKSRQKKLDERWGLEQSAKGTRFKLNRDLQGYHVSRRLEVVVDQGEPPVTIKIPEPPELKTKGDAVHFEDVSVRYSGASKPLLQGVSFTLEQGGRCSFIGANGHGKSTLVKLILGELKPASGKVTLHPLMRVGYFSQDSVSEMTRIAAKDAKLTALRYFAQEMERERGSIDEGEIRACLASFGLQGKTASDTPVALLSGGQKVRLVFALIVWKRPHMLVLDEITTHVDSPTLQALGETLRSYKGSLVLVTHDRWFNRVVIEGEKANARSHDSDDAGSTDDDTNATESRAGTTYRVGAGKVRPLPRGMEQYVALVEKRLEKEGVLG